MHTEAHPLKPLYYWHPRWRKHGCRHNFGDELFPHIAARIYGKPLQCTSTIIASPKFIAGGSTVNWHTRDRDTIWGAGLREAEGFQRVKLDIRAVRGPLTQQVLSKKYNIECPEIYGDPALLLPDLFPEWKPSPVPGRIGLVPHFRTRKRYKALPSHIRLISPARVPRKVVPEILQCEFIISGSLHGLIVAEAFGIPARWLAEDNDEPYFKYEDYYESTGRTPHPAVNLMRAEDLGGQERPDILIDKQALIAAFPHDVCLPQR